MSDVKRVNEPCSLLLASCFLLLLLLLNHHHLTSPELPAPAGTSTKHHSCLFSPDWTTCNLRRGLPTTDLHHSCRCRLFLIMSKLNTPLVAPSTTILLHTASHASSQLLLGAVLVPGHCQVLLVGTKGQWAVGSGQQEPWTLNQERVITPLNLSYLTHSYADPEMNSGWRIWSSAWQSINYTLSIVNCQLSIVSHLIQY